MIRYGILLLFGVVHVYCQTPSQDSFDILEFLQHLVGSYRADTSDVVGVITA